jgi:hypothetical protein
MQIRDGFGMTRVRVQEHQSSADSSDHPRIHAKRAAVRALAGGVERADSVVVRPQRRVTLEQVVEVKRGRCVLGAWNSLALGSRGAKPDHIWLQDPGSGWGSS